ncbi:hypothetical protein AO1008_04729 [Aspergillus oryzae 100-8]|uniref:Uncharacterized protein n=1 Tax=Aspergillus oryzae (strain 3.042) TaxID=1160506 RepID=I7ZPX0_ASPO3|nr:hypothetical protein Ao3042_10174 [Aspergillus oryzae 3.042]KDE78418.1 hypothetical protein AO1008_04729 [Aspergillus oryzae 100-8]|eukprot:EIT73927.1 hypothetical protein Ao3042_10174 [Aspergillus oryzae 3.042]
MANSTIHFQASLFPHNTDFLAHVTGQTRDSQCNLFLVYKRIQNTWIQDAWDYIEDNHEGRAVSSAWRENGLITPEDFRELHTYAGTTLDFDQGPYRGSKKDPDLFTLPTTCLFPCLAMESGWSEDLTEMENDVDMFDNYHVSGVVKVYKLDENGMPVHEGPDQVIFPKPADSQNQVIGVARGDIVGRTRFQDRNPFDTLEYPLDILREIATIALDRMGLVPA